MHPDLAKHESYPQITNRDICKLAKIFGVDTRAWKPHMKVTGATFLATIKSQMRVAIQPFIASKEEMKFMYNLYAHFPSLPKPKKTSGGDAFELWLTYFVGWLSALNNVQNITPVLNNPSEVVVNTTRMDPRDMLAPLDDYLFGMNKDGTPGDGSNNVQVLGVNVHDVYPTYRRYLQPNAVLVMIQILSPDGTKVPLLDEVLCMVNTSINREMSPRTNPLLLAHQLNTLLHWFDVIDHDDTVQFLDELTAVMNARNIYLPCPFATNGAQVLNNVPSMTRFWTIKPFLGTFFQNPRDLSNMYVTDEFRLITVSTLIKSHALTSTIALAILQQLTRVVPSEDRVYTNGDIFDKALRVIRTGTYPSGNLHPLGTGPMDSPCPITTMSVKKRYMALCIAECFVELQMRAFIRCGRIDVKSNAFFWHSLFTKAPVHFESMVDSIVSGNADLANVPMQLIYDLDIQLKMGTAHLDTRYSFAVPSQSLEPAVVDPLRTIEMYLGILIAKGLVDFTNINDLSSAYYDSLRGHLDVMPKTQVVWTPTFPNFFPGFRHDLCPRYENELNKMLQRINANGAGSSGGTANTLDDHTIRLLVKYSYQAHRVPDNALQAITDQADLDKFKAMAQEDLLDLEKHIAAINGVGIYRRRDHLADLVRRYTGDCMMARLGNSQNRERVRYLQDKYVPPEGADATKYWNDYNALLGGNGEEAIKNDRDVLKDVSKAANEVIHRVRGSNHNMMSVLRYDPNRRVARLGNPARDGAAPIDELSTSVAAVGVRGAIGAAASDAGTSFPGSVNLADPASEPSLLGTLRDVHSLVRRVMGLRLDDDRSRGMIRAGIRPMDVPAQDDTGENAFDAEYKRNMYMDVIQESIQEEYKRSKCGTLGDREDSIVDLAMKPSESGGGVVRRGAFGTDRDVRLLEEERRMLAENQKYGHATRHHIMLLDTIRSYVFAPQTSRFSSDTGSAGYDWDSDAYDKDGMLKRDHVHGGGSGQRTPSIEYMAEHEKMLGAVKTKHRIERLGYGVRNGVHPTVICVLREVPARLQFDEHYMPWLSDCKLSADLIHADVAQAVILAHNISLENLLFVMGVMKMDVISMYVSFCAWTNNVRASAPQMHTDNRPLQMAHFVRFLMRDRGHAYNFLPENIKGKFQFFRNALTKKYFEALNTQQNYAIRLTKCMHEVSLERKWYVCRKLIDWICTDHTDRGSVLEPVITFAELNSDEGQKIMKANVKDRPQGWQFDTDMLFQAIMHKLFFDDACNIVNSSYSKLDDFFSSSDGSQAGPQRAGESKRRTGFSKLRIDAGNVIDAITDTNVVLNPLFQYDENQHRFVLDQTKLMDDDRGPDETDATIIVTTLSKIRDVVDDHKYTRYRDLLLKMENALSAIHGNTYVTLKDASMVEASNLHPVATSVSPQPVYVPWWSHHDTVVFVNQCLWSVLNIRRQVENDVATSSAKGATTDGAVNSSGYSGEVDATKFQYADGVTTFAGQKQSSVTRYLFTRPETKLAHEGSTEELDTQEKYRSLFSYEPSVKVMEEIARERGAKSNLSAENIYDLEMAYTRYNKLMKLDDFKVATNRSVATIAGLLKSTHDNKKYTGKVMLHYVNSEVILPSRVHVWLLAYRDTYHGPPEDASKSLAYFKLPKVIETMFKNVTSKKGDLTDETETHKVLIDNVNLYLAALWEFVKQWVQTNLVSLNNALTLANVAHDDEEKRRTLVAMEAALGIHVIECVQSSPANLLQLPYTYMEKDTGENNARFTLRNVFNVAAIDDYFDYSRSRNKVNIQTAFQMSPEEHNE